MKSISSLAACVVLLTIVRAESPAKLEGFAGIPFGSNAQQAKVAMDSRGAHFNPDKSTSAHMEFHGGTLGTEDVLFWHLYFFDGKSFRADVRMNSPFNRRFAKYDEVKKLISDKYGPPSEATPTEAAQVVTEEAELFDLVRNGKATVGAKWIVEGGSIKCEIAKKNNEVWIRLLYEDEALTKVYTSRRMKDY